MSPTDYSITNEKLSAFLDGELPADELDWIRQQLAENQDLSERLAQLALANDEVVQHSQKMDSVPVPETTLAMLKDDTVINASGRFWQGVREHMAVAAGVVMMLGAAGGYWFGSSGQPTPSVSHWAAVQDALNSAPSGHQTQLADGTLFVGQFSFEAGNGEFCRVYHTRTEKSAHSLACYSDSDGWQAVASFFDEGSDTRFELAAQSSTLQMLVEEKKEGAILSANDELNRLPNPAR